jgi:hypothetical protein
MLKRRPASLHPSQQEFLMRTRLVTLLAVLSALLFGDGYRLSPRFRTVYIVSMTNSLDQHIASRLTSNRVLWVVLEPASADTVLTDTLDGNFWSWIDRTYPASPGSGAASRTDRGAQVRDPNPPSGKQQGTIFLVDPHSRLVLWSMYDLPKNLSPGELDRTASRISNQLKNVVAKP